jgi:hypothetical protein
MKKTAIAIVALSVLLLPVSRSLAADDSAAGLWAGTWKFNPAKSKFPGNPPQSDQVTIDPDFTITVEETSSTGKQNKWSYKPEDGKSVPVTGRGDNVTVVARKMGPYKTTQEWNYNGRTAKSYATISKDGKSRLFI